MLLLGAAGLLRRAGIWINLSPSMPVGLYRSRALAGSGTGLRRGVIVAACLPEQVVAWGRARGYVPRGRCPDGAAPVGKPIFAVAGDTVTATESGLGRDRGLVPDTRSLARDRAGRSLPRLAPGSYPVEPGQLWLVSTYVAASWDSRYYGPVPSARVIAILQPLWISRSRMRGW